MATVVWLLLISNFCIFSCQGDSQLPPTTDRDTSEIVTRCNSNCSGEKVMPVCASDGRTYNSICEVEKKTCEGSKISIKHQGKCQDTSRCWKDRASAQSQEMTSLPDPQTNDQELKGSTVSNFVPACKEDGSFAEVQCHPSSGYCWCATGDGRPIQGTSVRHKRPTCRGDRQGGGNKRKNHKRRNEKQGCGPKDRKLFNKNLVKIFMSEYKRISPPTRTSGSGRSATSDTSDAINDSLEMRAVRWKFFEQDHNGNDYLDKKELKSLRRMVKKFVKPTECAKKFSRLCDEDRNKKISRREWNICFGVDMNSEQTEDSTKEVPVNHPEGITTRKKQITLSPDDKTGLSAVDDEHLDCRTERQSALEQQKTSQGVIYIPECTSDGKYTKVQCYTSTGYCWCVDQDGGVPIRSTSVRDVRPDCEKMVKSDRPIKGCPEKKKTMFLVEFVEFLSSEMNLSLSSSTVDTVDVHGTNMTSLEDRLARWKFDSLDTNLNKVLDRQEWRIFRRDLKKRKSIRKCGRNFVKFCDENNDRKITFEEWMTCFNILKDRKHTSVPRRKQKGQNPLDKYLKSD